MDWAKRDRGTVSQGLAAATIRRRAVILGLDTAEASRQNSGADLSREFLPHFT